MVIPFLRDKSWIIKRQVNNYDQSTNYRKNSILNANNKTGSEYEKIGSVRDHVVQRKSRSRSAFARTNRHKLQEKSMHGVFDKISVILSRVLSMNFPVKLFWSRNKNMNKSFYATKN